MNRHIPLIICVASVLIPVFVMHSCANTTQAPTGGKKDTIPPYITNIVPLPGAVEVPLHGAKFYFEFNEYVKIKNPRNIFLSPPQAKPVIAKMKQKGIIVSFEEDLQPNTTYTISFVDAVADNNEGNMFAGYKYAFSTGTDIDSMMITGTIQDCNTLAPEKGATVLLYKDHSDSAIFLQRPYAAAKSDEWGFFCIPYIQDTLYRIYALKDDAGNNMYDPDVDLVAFVDSLVRPVMVANDTVKEMLNYDMKDTLSCLDRTSEYELNLFREKPSKQYLKNKKRTGDRSAYITFQAQYAWIDSLWIRGYPAEKLITNFNLLQDSLEIWINDSKPAPDTLHLYVNYRKTDSTGTLQPALEHHKLFIEGVGAKKRNSYQEKKKYTHEDSICVYKLEAKPEQVEMDGFELLFDLPVVTAKFDSLKFTCINARQQESEESYDVERDSLNPRLYRIKPRVKLMVGNDYILKAPQNSFRDIRGFWSDSTEVKVTLPKDEALSTLRLDMKGVDRKLIVDLLDEKRTNILRTYIIKENTLLEFPYLKTGKYYVRITEDSNENSIIDTGSLLEHRMPEKVKFAEFGKGRLLDIPESSEIEQSVNVQDLFR